MALSLGEERIRKFSLTNRPSIATLLGWDGITDNSWSQRGYIAIHRINHYPVDSVVCFANVYPLDSDLYMYSG